MAFYIFGKLCEQCYYANKKVFEELIILRIEDIFRIEELITFPKIPSWKVQLEVEKLVFGSLITKH